MRPYSALRRGDEIFAYCGRRWQQCRILATFPDSSSSSNILLRLIPVTARSPHCQETLRFKVDALVEVLPPTPPIQTAIARYAPFVLSRFTSPSLLLSPLEISDWLRDVHQVELTRTRVRAICKHLADQGQLKPRKARITRFRLPIPHEVGFPVVEFLEKPSQKLGWIVGWKLHHGTQSQQPIIHFLQGEERFSQEIWLDPAPATLRDQILCEQARIAGTLHIPTPIPDWMLQELREVWLDKPRQRNAALLNLAKFLGLVPADTVLSGGERRRRWSDRAHNQVLDYLANYYPTWNQGLRRAS